jgi:hypothetical protein
MGFDINIQGWDFGFYSVGDCGVIYNILVVV